MPIKPTKPPAKASKPIPEPVEEEAVEEEEPVEEEAQDEEPQAESGEDCTDEEVARACDVVEGRLQAEFAKKAAGPKGMEATGDAVGGWQDELALPIALVLLKWLRGRLGI